MYILFLKFLVVFCVWKTYKPCCHAQTFQLVSQRSLASIINKKPKILTQRPVATHTVPSGTNTIIGALVYQGIPVDLWIRPEQFHHLPRVLLPRWLKAVYSHILRLQQQKSKSIPLAAEFIYLATSAGCAEPIRRPIAVKGLTVCHIVFWKFQFTHKIIQFEHFNAFFWFHIITR